MFSELKQGSYTGDYLGIGLTYKQLPNMLLVFVFFASRIKHPRTSPSVIEPTWPTVVFHSFPSQSAPLSDCLMANDLDLWWTYQEFDDVFFGLQTNLQLGGPSCCSFPLVSFAFSAPRPQILSAGPKDGAP